MSREYYDRDEVDTLEDEDDGEEYIRQQLTGSMKTHEKAEKEFNFRKESERLRSKTKYMDEVLENELWLVNGAIGDPEIAELVCGARLVTQYPFVELARAIRDLHNGGLAPQDIYSRLQEWPLLSPTYKERLECLSLDPEEKEAFYNFYRRQRNEAALAEALEYAVRNEYVYRPDRIIEILAKHSPVEIALPKKVSRMRNPEDVRRWMNRIAERDSKRVKTSYEQINLYTGGGLKLGALYGVAAPTGGGKSIVLCCFCADFASQGYRVLFVSTEMLEDDIHERINRCMTGTHTNEAAGLKVIAKMELDSFFGYDVWSAEELSSTVAEIEQKAKESEYDVIIVDYGDKLSAGGATESEYNRQGIIFSQLSRLAKRLDVPVIVASQQNREALKNPKGGMETIGDSMDKLRPLEMLFSIPYYDLSQMPNMRNKKILTIQKNRNGIKDVELFFDIDYDAWRMSEPQYIRDCITANKSLGPQGIYLSILEAQKAINKETKHAVVEDDDKND